MSHNGVIATQDTITWVYIYIMYIKPRGAERCVLYDHRLEPMVSPGYLDPEGPIPGMSTMRS
eukprot:8821648-Heterocapsa_arctica.AAC.1